MSPSSSAASGAVLLLQKSAGHVALATRLCERFPEALETIGEWERSANEFIVIVAAGGQINIAFAKDAEALRQELPLVVFELKDRLGTLDGIGFSAKGHDPDFAVRWDGFWSGCVNHLRDIDDMDGAGEAGPTVH
jgi:hypothetical protein